MSCTAVPMDRSFAAAGGECSSARTGFLRLIVAGIALAVSVLLFPVRLWSILIPASVLPVLASSQRRRS